MRFKPIDFLQSTMQIQGKTKSVTTGPPFKEIELIIALEKNQYKAYFKRHQWKFQDEEDVNKKNKNSVNNLKKHPVIIISNITR